MKKITHYLTDKEKIILENYLIFNKYNSNNDYYEWIADYFSNYGIKQLTVKQLTKQTDIPNIYQIDNIWDKDSNTSLVQHFFRHKKFKPSVNKLKFFHIFNPDWSHVDNYGNNILHDVAKYKIIWLDHFLTKSIPSVINSEGYTYHMLLAKNEYINPITPLISDDFKQRCYWRKFSSLLFDINDDFIKQSIYLNIKKENIVEFTNFNLTLVSYLTDFLEYTQNKITDSPEQSLAIEKFKSQMLWLQLNHSLEQKLNQSKTIKI